MENAMTNLSDNELWMDALAVKFEGGKPFGRKEWDQLLGHCQVNTCYCSAFSAWRVADLR